jgi:hypothetical protein
MLWWNGIDVENPKNSVKTFSVFTNTTWTGLELNHGLRIERPETNFLNQGLVDVLLSEILGHRIF